LSKGQTWVWFPRDQRLQRLGHGYQKSFWNLKIK
jgi:hypothetical protein